MRPRYYKLADGVPVVCTSAAEWAAWYETADEERIVEQTEIRPFVRVSTVFLGLDHNFSGEGAPLLYETLVFGGDLHGEGNRYSTLIEAQSGHRAICERVRHQVEAPTTAVQVHVFGDPATAHAVDVDDEECPACVYANEHLALKSGEHALLVADEPDGRRRVYRTEAQDVGFGMGFLCRLASDEELARTPVDLAKLRR